MLWHLRSIQCLAPFCEQQMCARHCAKCFTYITIIPTLILKESSISSTPERWHWSPGTFNAFLIIYWPENEREEIQNPCSLNLLSQLLDIFFSLPSQWVKFCENHTDTHSWKLNVLFWLIIWMAEMLYPMVLQTKLSIWNLGPI